MEVKDEQFANKLTISVIFDVSKCEKSIKVILEHL